MIVEKTFYNVKCDICGALYDEEYWWDVVDVDGTWIEHEGKDICPECYEYDDDDNLIIKDKNENNNN